MLQKETRDAARKAGQDGGKTYSDEMAKAFRERFAKASGFEKTLGSHDQKVIAQFRRLGGFSSKAYATRFEKSIIPAYQDIVKKLVHQFGMMTEGGKVIDLRRNFTGGPETEAEIRRIKDLFDELDVARRSGVAKDDSLLGLDVGALNRYRKALQETIDAGDWELVGKKQLGLTEAINDGVDAMQRGVAVINERRAAMDRDASLESQRFAELQRFNEQVNKLIQERRFGDNLSDTYRELAAAARDAVKAEEERATAEIRANRIAIDRHNLSKQQQDIDEDILRAIVARAREEERLISVSEQTLQLEELRRRSMAGLSDEMRELMDLSRQYAAGELDLADELAEVENDRELILQRQLDLEDERVRTSLRAIRARGEELIQSRQLTELNRQEILTLVDLDQARHTLIRGTEEQRSALLGYMDAQRESNELIFEHHDAITEMIRDRGELSEVTQGLSRGQTEFTEGLERYLVNQIQSVLATREGAEATDEAAAATRNATRDVRLHTISLAGLGDAFRGGGKDATFFGNAMDFLGKKLSKVGTSTDLNARAIVGIIAVLGEPIAVLGASLGPALIAVGGAATAAVSGVGALVAVFSTLRTPVKDLPEDLRAVATEFHGLGGAMSELKLDIARAAFSNMADTFPKLQRSVTALTPEFELLGRTVGDIFDDFATAVQPGTRAFEQLQDSLRHSAPLFQSMVESVGQLGLALLTAFNRANPLVQRLVGWIDELIDSFDEFVQGPGFDDWIGHGLTVFQSLNRLLAATGQMLNNLVTDETVARTAAFIDNLAAFAPHLENIIRFFGELDVLGLLSQALDEFGNALLPLVPVLDQLASALNEQLVAGITGMADALALLAHAAALVIGPIAHMLDALPPAVLQATAYALTLLAAGIGAVVAVRGVAKMAAAVSQLGASLTYLPKAGTRTAAAMDRLAPSMSRLVNGAGAVGAIAVGAAALATALDQLATGGRKAAPGIEQVQDALRSGDLDFAFSNASQSVDSFAESLTLLAGSGFGSALERNTQNFVTSLTGVTGSVEEARRGMTAMDDTLANLVSAGRFKEAEFRFARLTDAAKEQGIPVEELKKLFPEYADALAGALPPLKDNVEGLEDLDGAARGAVRSIEDIADAIDSFGDTTLDTRAAQRDFLDAVREAKDTFTEYAGSIRIVNGEIDTTTEAGSAMQSSLDGMARAAKDSAKAIETQTGSQELANGALKLGHDAVIAQLEALGITGPAAELYADKLGLVTVAEGEAQVAADLQTASLQNTFEAFGLTGTEAAGYITQLDGIPKGKETFIQILNAQPSIDTAEEIATAINLIKNKTVTITVNANVGALPGIGLFNSQLVVTRKAAGGVAWQPQHVIFGEAGPEALVPLRRQLSQVDPSVRALSAIAQGKTPLLPRMASGGVSGAAGRTLNISPGAITIQGSMQPEAAATNVVNRIAERLGG